MWEKQLPRINLGACLAIRNQRVLLIDLDPQGMATAGLGRSMVPKKGIYAAMMDGQRILDHIQGTELDNFYLCPCSPELAGAEVELVKMENREKKFKETIAPVKNHFHFILIDCPPSLGFFNDKCLDSGRYHSYTCSVRVFLHGRNTSSFKHF